MKKIDFNNVSSSVIQKLNIIDKLVFSLSYDLNTLIINGDILTIDVDYLGKKYDLAALITSDLVSIKLKSKKEEYNIMCTHLFRITPELALKVLEIDGIIKSRIYCKIEHNLISGNYQSLNEEFTLKYEKR